MLLLYNGVIFNKSLRIMKKCKKREVRGELSVIKTEYKAIVSKIILCHKN